MVEKYENELFNERKAKADAWMDSLKYNDGGKMSLDYDYDPETQTLTILTDRCDFILSDLNQEFINKTAIKNIVYPDLHIMKIYGKEIDGININCCKKFGYNPDPIGLNLYPNVIKNCKITSSKIGFDCWRWKNEKFENIVFENCIFDTPYVSGLSILEGDILKNCFFPNLDTICLNIPQEHGIFDLIDGLYTAKSMKNTNPFYPDLEPHEYWDIYLKDSYDTNYHHNKNIDIIKDYLKLDPDSVPNLKNILLRMLNSHCGGTLDYILIQKQEKIQYASHGMYGRRLFDKPKIRGLNQYIINDIFFDSCLYNLLFPHGKIELQNGWVLRLIKMSESYSPIQKLPDEIDNKVEREIFKMQELMENGTIQIINLKDLDKEENTKDDNN